MLKDLGHVETAVAAHCLPLITEGKTMLVKTSGFLSDHLALLTLGHSCLYLICLNEHTVLVDPGLASYFPYLQKRLRTFSDLTISDITDVLLTNLQPERVSAVAMIRQFNPDITVHAGFNLHEKVISDGFSRQLFLQDRYLSQDVVGIEPLQMTTEQFVEFWRIDHFVKDGETIISDSAGEIRGFPFPAHTDESWCYFLTPEHFIIADQGLGYYQGKEFATPGADQNLQTSISALKRLMELNIMGVALPCYGALTGKLAQDYLTQLIANCEQLLEEVKQAFTDNLPQEHIYHSIEENLFHSTTSDLLIKYKLSNSLQAIWAQLKQLQDDKPGAHEF